MKPTGAGESRQDEPLWVQSIERWAKRPAPPGAHALRPAAGRFAQRPTHSAKYRAALRRDHYSKAGKRASGVRFPSSAPATDGGPDSDAGRPDTGSGLDGSPGIDSGRLPDGGPDAGPDDEVFVSTRSDRGDPWGVPVLVAEFSSPLSEVAPTPTANANVLLFVRNFGTGAGKEDILRATRPGAGAMWTFAPLASPINTADIDTAPSLGLSGTLYFSTDRAGGPREIWQAAPDAFGTGWLAPTPMTELNDTFGVTDPWISLDERRIYYVTNQTGRDEIYVRSR